MSFAIPANESGRLEALRRYQILDTAPEVAYDEITELAAQICGCPVAVIGFVDEAQDWKKSKYGLPAHFTGLPREGSDQAGILRRRRGSCSRRAVPVAAQRCRLRILAMANDPRGDNVI